MLLSQFSTRHNLRLNVKILHTASHETGKPRRDVNHKHKALVVTAATQWLVLPANGFHHFRWKFPLFAKHAADFRMRNPDHALLEHRTASHPAQKSAYLRKGGAMQRSQHNPPDLAQETSNRRRGRVDFQAPGQLTCKKCNPVAFFPDLLQRCKLVAVCKQTPRCNGGRNASNFRKSEDCDSGFQVGIAPPCSEGRGIPTTRSRWATRAGSFLTSRAMCGIEAVES